jgi:hypothetical protein
MVPREKAHPGWVPGRGFQFATEPTVSEPTGFVAQSSARLPAPEGSQYGVAVAVEEAPPSSWELSRLDRRYSREMAEQEDAETRQRQRARRVKATGEYGFRRFYRGRPELTGTPEVGELMGSTNTASYLTMNRPPIHEDLHPGGRPNIAERLVAGRQARAHGQAADDLVGEWEHEREALQRRMRGKSGPGAFPTNPRMRGGPASPYRWAGSLPKGSQFTR